MIVVPKELQLSSTDGVASEFFRATLSHVGSGKTDPVRILSAFMAISSFGNVMVMLFVAARGTHVSCSQPDMPTLRTYIVYPANEVPSEARNIQRRRPPLRCPPSPLVLHNNHAPRDHKPQTKRRIPTPIKHVFLHRRLFFQRSPQHRHAQTPL